MVRTHVGKPPLFFAVPVLFVRSLYGRVRHYHLRHSATLNSRVPAAYTGGCQELWLTDFFIGKAKQHGSDMKSPLVLTCKPQRSLLTVANNKKKKRRESSSCL